MYILFKYDYNDDERIILNFKISNDINDILPMLPSPPSNTDEIITIWPGDYIHQYIVLTNYDRIEEVKKPFYDEVIKLSKQCFILNRDNKIKKILK
jgi:hypothetical protein